MIGDVVAQRYAHALFEMGEEKGVAELEQYGNALAALDRMLAEAPELDRLFKTPVITPEEKRRVLRELLTRIEADDTVLRFCSLLADKERLSLLPAIAAAFGARLDAVKGIARGSLTTAVDLDEKRRAALVARLEKQTGKTLALRFEVDPAVLGGVVLRIGDKVLDASLRAQLDILRDIIKRGE